MVNDPVNNDVVNDPVNNNIVYNPSLERDIMVGIFFYQNHSLL